MKAGVLALQGDFREHAAMFASAGAIPIEVRGPEELSNVDCLAIPGGESTAISKLAGEFGLIEPIRDRAKAGMPVFGTCAGLILMATEVDDRPGLLSLLDVSVRRNAYGRQRESFESDVDVYGVGHVRAVFIRAPRIERVGPEVEILAEHEGEPVVLRQGNLVAAAFHPEIARDDRLHRLTLALAR